jgi:hypothetical protein
MPELTGSRELHMGQGQELNWILQRPRIIVEPIPYLSMPLPLPSSNAGGRIMSDSSPFGPT